MKIKMLCDKKYGGRYDINGNVTTMDCSFFNGNILDRIVKHFSENGIIEMSQKVVDYYNRDNSTGNKISFKTAENLAKYIRKYYP